jgi:hypothetical protein
MYIIFIYNYIFTRTKQSKQPNPRSPIGKGMEFNVLAVT